MTSGRGRDVARNIASPAGPDRSACRPAKSSSQTAGRPPLRSCGSSARNRAENALLSVNLQQIGAKNFRELTGGGAAHRVHLPESILCGDVSLREK